MPLDRVAIKAQPLCQSRDGRPSPQTIAIDDAAKRDAGMDRDIYILQERYQNKGRLFFCCQHIKTRRAVSLAFVTMMRGRPILWYVVVPHHCDTVSIVSLRKTLEPKIMERDCGEFQFHTRQAR